MYTQQVLFSDSTRLNESSLWNERKTWTLNMSTMHQSTHNLSSMIFLDRERLAGLSGCSRSSDPHATNLFSFEGRFRLCGTMLSLSPPPSLNTTKCALFALQPRGQKGLKRNQWSSSPFTLPVSGQSTSFPLQNGKRSSACTACLWTPTRSWNKQRMNQLN